MRHVEAYVKDSFVRTSNQHYLRKCVNRKKYKANISTVNFILLHIYSFQPSKQTNIVRLFHNIFVFESIVYRCLVDLISNRQFIISTFLLRCKRRVCRIGSLFVTAERRSVWPFKWDRMMSISRMMANTGWRWTDELIICEWHSCRSLKAPLLSGIMLSIDVKSFHDQQLVWCTAFSRARVVIAIHRFSLQSCLNSTATA